MKHGGAQKDATSKQNSFKGPDGFESWYAAMFGERWPTLRTSVNAEGGHFELSDGLIKPYYLDTASVIAAISLDVSPGMTVLDLCAAPGGKSLVLAQSLFADNLSANGGLAGENSRMVLNERSADRRGRLKRVIAEHVPEHLLHALSVTGHDAARWGNFEQGIYDRILLDVPCSSEAHLIQNPKYLADWSPGRSSRLADQAFAMLLSAAKALVTGGTLIYSTCAFSELENDRVIERVLERAAKAKERLGIELAVEQVEFDSLDEELDRRGRQIDEGSPSPAERLKTRSWIESTRLGYQIWPDKSGGRGPIYFCKIRRVS